MIAAASFSIDPTLVEYGLCARPMPGQTESGDLHVVASFMDGILIAAIDGLGHGSEAAAAAQAAHEEMSKCPRSPVGDLMQNCHAALRKTRGVVLSMASIDARRNELTWAGVGNVEGALYRANPAAIPPREALPQRGGVVGYRLPPMRVATLPVGLDDVLIFATDGIDGGYRCESPIGWSPQDFADHVVKHHGKETDDALVLVVRYRGLGRDG